MRFAFSEIGREKSLIQFAFRFGIETWKYSGWPINRLGFAFAFLSLTNISTN